MNVRHALPKLPCCLGAALGMFALAACAQSPATAQLRLVPDADYLRLELAFDPSELNFKTELHPDQAGELNPAELQARAPALASRVADALRLTVGGRRLRFETAALDPALDGHHARLRATCKVDARRQPLTVESGLFSITSPAHVTQVTYAHAGGTQTRQLDAQTRQVTFTPPAERNAPQSSRETAVYGLLLLLLAVLALLVVGAGVLLYLRRRIG